MYPGISYQAGGVQQPPPLPAGYQPPRIRPTPQDRAPIAPDFPVFSGIPTTSSTVWNQRPVQIMPNPPLPAPPTQLLPPDHYAPPVPAAPAVPTALLQGAHAMLGTQRPVRQAITPEDVESKLSRDFNYKSALLANLRFSEMLDNARANGRVDSESWNRLHDKAAEDARFALKKSCLESGKTAQMYLRDLGLPGPIVKAADGLDATPNVNLGHYAKLNNGVTSAMRDIHDAFEFKMNTMEVAFLYKILRKALDDIDEIDCLTRAAKTSPQVLHADVDGYKCLRELLPELGAEAQANGSSVMSAELRAKYQNSVLWYCKDTWQV